MPKLARLFVASATQGQPLRPISKPVGPYMSQTPSSLRPDGHAWSLRTNFVHRSAEDRSSTEPSTSGRATYQSSAVQRIPVPNRPAAFVADDGGRMSVVTSSAGGSLDDAGSQGSWRTARVRFWLKFRTEFGQSVRVVGSHEQLGSWNLLAAPKLSWSEGDLWNATIDLPAGGVFEYKYAVVASDGRTAAAWQRGNNSVIAVRHDDTELEVFDNWEGNPGAAVVAGGTSTTREGRLLNWASEMEAILTAQRNELRETRMQLFEAQEEARSARQDAVQLRTDLILATQARLEAERKLSVVEVENTQLRMELSRKSYEFKMALEECRRLLEEVTAVDISGTEAPEPVLSTTSIPQISAAATQASEPSKSSLHSVPSAINHSREQSSSKLPFQGLFSSKPAQAVVSTPQQRAQASQPHTSAPSSQTYTPPTNPTTPRIPPMPAMERKYVPQQVRPPMSRPSVVPPPNAKGQPVQPPKHLIKV